MAIVDDRGRVLGRWNLVDAVLGLLAIGLLPLGYGAYALLRTPPPQLTAVEPASLTEGSDLRVTIRGENLRPFYRISFGNVQGLSFLFQDSTRAQVDLNPMPPGVYDVVLYDFQQERMRLPKAFTILPAAPTMPTSFAIMVGMFSSLEPDRAALVKPGLKVEPDGEVLTVGKPIPARPRVFGGATMVEIPVEARVQVPAVIRIGCRVRAPGGTPECAHADFPLRPPGMVGLQTSAGKLAFQIDQVRGTQPLEPLAVIVRFAGPQQSVGRIREGDVDVGTSENELSAGARVVAAGSSQSLSGDSISRDVTLRLMAQKASSGWVYATGELKIGAVFALRTTDYVVSGVVLSVAPQRTQAGEP